MKRLPSAVYRFSKTGFNAVRGAIRKKKAWDYPLSLISPEVLNSVSGSIPQDVVL